MTTRTRSSILQVTIDQDLRKRAEVILKQLGISPSQAVKMLYAQIDLKKGVPFEMIVPQQEDRLTEEEQKDIKEALEDYKEGRYAELNSPSEIDDYFKKLDTMNK